MKEIEVLIEVKSSKEDVLKALGQFTDHGIKRTLDIYFSDPLRKDLQPDEKGRLRASFRLRQKGGDCFIAYKIDHFAEGDEWLYSDEHETSIGDFDTAIRIVDHLGLKELIRIDNEKHVFTTQEFEIVFEDVKDLGYFLEVEKIEEVSDDQTKSTKQGIRDFLNGLGLHLGTELNTGKPELMLAKKKSY